MAGALALFPWLWFVVRGLGSFTEPVAVGLPLLVLAWLFVVALTALLTRRPELVVAFATTLLFGWLAVFGPRTAIQRPAPADPFLLASANAYEENRTPEEAVRAILATDADVLLVVETNEAERSALEGSYPYQLVQEQLVLLSRYPVERLPMPPDLPERRVLRARVDAPGGPFVLYEVHALNPLYETSFADQFAFVDALRSAAAGEDLPVVIAGDFNMTDRGQAYASISSELVDAMRAGHGATTTFDDGVWKLLSLRIDHVFVGRAWCAADAREFAIPGSDHDGVQVRLGPCG